MPRDGDFFVLFRKQAENIVSGANAFTSMLEHYTGVPEQVQCVKAIEHQGDEITHQIFRKLNQTFITPFDREDMHELCGTMDDVIDLIDAAASRFVLYRVDRVRAGTIDLNRLENESDRICRTLIAQLFEEEKDPVQIIKWKEIFEVNETAVDKCEDVSNVIESVILKNA